MAFLKSRLRSQEEKSRFYYASGPAFSTSLIPSGRPPAKGFKAAPEAAAVAGEKLRARPFVDPMPELMLSEKGELVFKVTERPVPRPTVPRAVGPTERVPTGIPGFDELIEGGIPARSSILVNGSCGSGKSIFCMQSLVNGALNGEPAVYVTFEEEPESLRESARLFNWPVDELEEQKVLRIIFKDPYEIKDFSRSLSGEIYYTLKDIRVKRVAIDSITYLKQTIQDVYEIRKTLSMLVKRLKELDCITLLISEISEDELKEGKFGIEEFVTDAVVNLHNFLMQNRRVRGIEILKMRKTNHDNYLHPFLITNKGIIVKPRERILD